MFRKKIDIKYHKNITPLKQVDGGDWIDLRTAEPKTIEPFSVAKISLGVSMKLPKNHEAHILPRSSTFKHFGLLQTNGMGIIDEAYCGNDDIWFVEVFNPTPKTMYVPFDARICQFRIVKKMPKLKLNIVRSLTSKNRGGHGSSGIF